MKAETLWKIFTTDKSVMILTDVPRNFRNGDGAYFLMKQLQKIYGSDLCSIQKYDERFDKIEDFDIILRTGFNLDGNRLLSVHLFEYDKKKKTVKVNCGNPRKMENDNDGYTYRIRQTKINAQDGWNGFRKFILWTMGDDSCSRFWGDAQFGECIFTTDRISA